MCKRAELVTPGGINTAHRLIDPPLAFGSASGSRIVDVDGNEYVDYHLAFGAIFLGHCYGPVQEAVKRAIDASDLFGVGITELECRAAEKIVQHVPSIEKVLFCNCGSEATYHAVRLSRAVTGRTKIVKFRGCYHGWHDYLLVECAPTNAQLGARQLPSAGMLRSTLEETIVLPFNDLDAVEEAAAHHDIACVILEPIPHNVGCIMPKEGYLAGLREICDRHDVILVFDEVITGFRHHLGGFQALCGVRPDLTTFGKAIANGYPVAAIGGRADLMDRFTTAGGDVYFSGTFNGHPAAMAAVVATIEVLESEPVYDRVFSLGRRMREGMQAIVEELGVEAYTAGFGSVFVTYFMNPPIERYEDLLRNNVQMFVTFRREMTRRGFFMMPTNLKRNALTYSHTETEVDDTLAAAREVLKGMSR
jgi:glutamate-1-semialdehyde 2,1-aminomutase